MATRVHDEGAGAALTRHGSNEAWRSERVIVANAAGLDVVQVIDEVLRSGGA